MPNWQDAKLARHQTGIHSSRDKGTREREARALLWKEQEIAHKERQAQPAERIYLEEDAQEKKILRQKMKDAKRENAIF